MIKKQILIAGTVLGALSMGQQIAHADTIGNTNGTTISSVSSNIDDGTNVNNSSSSNSSEDSKSSSPSNTDESQANSNTNNSSEDIHTSTDTDNGSSNSKTPDDGTNIDNGSSSNNTDNSNSSSSNTDNSGSSSSSSSSSNTDNNGSASSSTDKNSGSSNSTNENSSSSSKNTDDSATSSSNGSQNTVPLTPTTPDTNDQGEVNHVQPGEVQADNTGNVVDVPTQVASVPSVARAVQDYNKALDENDKDNTKAPVVEAKKNLDEAITKALPLTGVTKKSSFGGNGILALAMSGLVALGGLIYKRKHL